MDNDIETRNILDPDENIIGELSLPSNTSEEEWARRLNIFSCPPPNPTIEQKVFKIVSDAIAFGQNIIIENAAQNILLGITQHGMTAIVRSRLSSVIGALSTGSLYDAIDELKAIPNEDRDGTFISDARILDAVNKIEKYLNIELSTSA